VPEAEEEIDNFIRLFDQVTTRTTWQRFVTASAPEIARFARREVCFFTAWDFHLSSEQGWQLIECNDNGSGFLFAALINRLFYELSELVQDRAIEEPPSMDEFREQLASFIEREAKEFFGALPDGWFFVLETLDTLRSGKFYRELILLRDLLRHRGWRSEIGTPDDLRWDGNYLLLDRQPVVFVINRSTDFSGKQRCFCRYVRPIWKAKCISLPIRLPTPRGAISACLNFSPCQTGIKSSGFFQRSEPY
jgi:hypothetical protein